MFCRSLKIVRYAENWSIMSVHEIHVIMAMIENESLDKKVVDIPLGCVKAISIHKNALSSEKGEREAK